MMWINLGGLYRLGVRLSPEEQPRESQPAFIQKVRRQLGRLATNLRAAPNVSNDIAQEAPDDLPAVKTLSASDGSIISIDCVKEPERKLND